MIVDSSPPSAEMSKAETAWIESDAPDNDSAIREIDEAAAKYGLVRTREHWLQVYSRDGRVVRRGICYRPVPSQAAEKVARVASRRAADPEGVASVDIVRADREA